MNHKDFAVSLIATAPIPQLTGTTLGLTAGLADRMPPVPFYANAVPPTESSTLDNTEKLLITDVDLDTDVLTIVRAQGETTAKLIDVNWVLANCIYADDIDSKVDKVIGKGLSTEDYTTAEKSKLAGIAPGAEVNNISDTDATDLTDGGATTLHKHSYNNLDDKPDLSTLLKIDQTIPQTTTGTFTFPQVATSILKPSSDSTSSIGVFKADGTTNIINFDTTNSRVGIGTIAPTAAIHINSGSFDHQLVLSGPNNIVGETAGIEFKYNGSGIGAIARIIALTQSGGGGDIQFQTAATGASSYVTKVTINRAGVLLPVQATTAAAPAYVKGGLYFDTTLNKLRVGGATAWETVTSA